MREETERAEEFARRAHHGQRDRAGAPYTNHLERVSARLEQGNRAAAWLHDVLEDTETSTEELREAGITRETLRSVTTLTRRSTETYREYIRRIAESGDATAIAVKRADLADHLEVTPEAAGAGLRRRYERAAAELAGARPRNAG